MRMSSLSARACSRCVGVLVFIIGQIWCVYVLFSCKGVQAYVFFSDESELSTFLFVCVIIISVPHVSETNRM